MAAPRKCRQDVGRLVREAAKATSRGAGRAEFPLHVGKKPEDSEQERT